MLTAITRHEEDDLPPPDPAAESAPLAPDALRPFDMLRSDILPTDRTAVVMPMKGKAERKFFEAVQSKDPLVVFKGWNDLVLAVTPAVDGIPTTDEMIMAMDDADMRAIMLMCRRRTHSNSVVEWKWRCQPPFIPKHLACKNKGSNESSVDIDQMMYRPAPKVTTAVMLPHLGKPMTVLRPTRATVEKYLKLRKGRETVDQTEMMVAREVRIEGRVVSAAELDDLIGEDRAVIKREMGRECGPESKVEYVCKFCGAEGSSYLETLPGFFFPGGEA